MTIATQPQHGERACYHRGCRQPECVDANSRYCKQYRLARHHTGTLRTPAAPIAERVRRYADAGWSRQQIAHYASVSETTIVDLLTGTTKRLNPGIAAALRALPHQPIDVPGRAYVDATGTIRRGRALYRIGHQVDDMAAELGLHPDSLSVIINRANGIVLASTATSMTALYKRLRWTPGHLIANRTRGETRGWHGPLAWTDGTIDDPETQPDTEKPDDTATAVSKRDEVEHLAGFGIAEPEICQRTGASEAYVRQIITELRTGTPRARKPAAAPDQEPLDLGNAAHGRSGYTLGCRCRTCRDGAAAASRTRRANKKADQTGMERAA